MPTSSSAPILRAALGFVFAMTAVVRAGTLVFPSSSTAGQAVVIPNGCSSVTFRGGVFFSGSGGPAYALCDVTGCATSPGIDFTPAPATTVTFAVTNAATPTGAPEDAQRIRMIVSDLGACPEGGGLCGFTVEQAFPKGGTAAVTLNGIAITNFSFVVLNYLGYEDTISNAWVIGSMSATQPIKPTLILNVQRNGDGTFTANIHYTFPSQSAPGDRTLTLELLPQGDEQGVTYPITAQLSTSGSISVPLGTFDTDRMLRATATACAGTADAEASISGCGQCKGPAKSVGGPVRLFDGVMTYSESDPLPATIGNEFHREYSSGAAADGRFGKGWSSLFDASAMAIDADGSSVAVVSEDRMRAVFRLLTTGQWSQTWPMGGTTGTLTGSAAAGYVFRDAGGSIVRTFGPNHHLTRLQDLRRNRAVSVTYDGSGNPTGIFDETGNWFCTVTTSSGHIVGIAVDGRPDLAWTYAYNGPLLTSVTAAGAPGPWRSYDYASGRLSAIHDATGAVIESHDYDAMGRATSSLGATGDITSIQYPASDANGIATTSVTRADNSQATYQQAFTAGEVVTQKADGGCSSCGTNDATAAYDDQGNLTRLQNARGYITLSSYDAPGRHLTETRTAMTPSGCNPETDPAHCRLSSSALAVAALAPTTATQTTDYVYADANWPDRPTRITRNSVLWSGVSTETFTFDAATGETLVHSMSGAVDSAGTQEVHTTTTALYDGTETAAFAPGGAFQSAWLSLPQPGGLRKSVDGPRTDVADVATYVYYPIDNAVPGAWRGRLAAVRDALGHVTRFETTHHSARLQRRLIRTASSRA
jgi:YD repeat-containing protein